MAVMLNNIFLQKYSKGNNAALMLVNKINYIFLPLKIAKKAWFGRNAFDASYLLCWYSPGDQGGGWMLGQSLPILSPWYFIWH